MLLSSFCNYDNNNNNNEGVKLSPKLSHVKYKMVQSINQFICREISHKQDYTKYSAEDRQNIQAHKEHLQ